MSVRSKAFLLAATVLAMAPGHALALRFLSTQPDGRDAIMGNDTGAAAVYTFDENGGEIAYDTSAVGSPLNLRMSTEGNLPTADGSPIRTNAFLMNGYLLVNPKPNGAPSDPDQGYVSAQRHRSFLISDTVATKLNQCSNGFTIQAFVRPHFPFQGSNFGNMIVGLTNSSSTQGSTAAATNFGLFQSGNVGDESMLLQVRTGSRSVEQSSATGAFSSVRESENPGRLTEVIATQEPGGVLTVYVNRIAKSSLNGVTPGFTSTAKLVVGNDLVPLPPATRDRDGNYVINVDQQRNWSGEIHHLAIYCYGFTRAEILGTKELNRSVATIVRPANSSGRITESRIEARRMLERLTGSLVPVDHPMVVRMEEKIASGDRLGAAKIATGDLATNEPGHPEFLNTLVKQFALRMSNREVTIRAPLNDFAASFIGVTRDEASAKDLLTGDFYYMADPVKATVRSDFFRDMLISNNHYDDLEKGQWDLGKVLVRVPGPAAPATHPKGQQIALSSTGSISPNPDPAGVITSRAFMSEHAVAGTNRRLVEYAFKSFLCVPMSAMADTSASPARIGRDVDRIPGGDLVKFETSCKGCHTVMDGFRGAFARFDFSNVQVGNVTYNVVRHTQLNKSGDFGFATGRVDRNDVVRKMNHNENVFPNGFEITDESFVNNAVGLTNRSLFGWRGARARGGVGVNQFGHMIADSTRFSQCMAKRAIETVCSPSKAGSEGTTKVTPFIEAMAINFEKNGYKLRALFQDVAANPVCAMKMGH